MRFEKAIDKEIFLALARSPEAKAFRDDLVLVTGYHVSAVDKALERLAREGWLYVRKRHAGAKTLAVAKRSEAAALQVDDEDGKTPEGNASVGGAL